MEIQLGAVKRIHGLLKTEAESYEGLLGEEHGKRIGKGEDGAQAPGLGADPSLTSSTITDPQELARPGQDPDPELECALRQFPEASTEACQCPHLPRTEGDDGTRTIVQWGGCLP